MGGGQARQPSRVFPALSDRGNPPGEAPGRGRLCRAAGPAEGQPSLGSFLPTQRIESLVQFLLDLQTILKIYKNIFIQKIGSKNDNSSKVSLSLGAASWDVKKAASAARLEARW